MYGGAEIIPDHPGPEFQQLTDDLRLGPGVGIFIGNPLDNDAQQLSDGVTH